MGPDFFEALGGLNQLRLPDAGALTLALANLSKRTEEVVESETGGSTQDRAASEIVVPLLRTFTVILSSMRSGSTLLKALLANHPNFSHLPEIDFQRFAASPERWLREMSALTSEPHIVLKLPCSFRECRTYPVLPDIPELHHVVLFRDPAETVASLWNMNTVKNQYRELVIEDLVTYWCTVYERILCAVGASKQTTSISYEALTTRPRETTRLLFRNMGIECEGFETYEKPKTYSWQWNLDDGGPVIKTLRVQQIEKDARLVALSEELRSHPRVRAVYEELKKRELDGYQIDRCRD